jgi:hypothetical protein
MDILDTNVGETRIRCAQAIFRDFGYEFPPGTIMLSQGHDDKNCPPAAHVVIKPENRLEIGALLQRCY